MRNKNGSYVSIQIIDQVYRIWMEIGVAPKGFVYYLFSIFHIIRLIDTFSIFSLCVCVGNVIHPGKSHKIPPIHSLPNDLLHTTGIKYWISVSTLSMLRFAFTGNTCVVKPKKAGSHIKTSSVYTFFVLLFSALEILIIKRELVNWSRWIYLNSVGMDFVYRSQTNLCAPHIEYFRWRFRT